MYKLADGDDIVSIKFMNSFNLPVAWYNIIMV